MKNVTLKIDDETYRRARVRAASRGTSVSAMVRQFLSSLSANSDSDEQQHQRIVDKLKEIYREADARATPRDDAKPLVPLSREEIHAERLR